MWEEDCYGCFIIYSKLKEKLTLLSNCTIKINLLIKVTFTLDSGQSDSGQNERREWDDKDAKIR